MTRVVGELLSLAVLGLVTLIGVEMLAFVLGFQLLLTLTILVSPLFFKKRWYKWIYIFYKTLPRDVIALVRYIKINLYLRSWEANQKSVPKLFHDCFNKHPKKICFHFEETEWTFQQVEEYSNKLARYFKNQGYQKGDIVSLILENRPEYVCVWLGLSKIGVITALINTNLVNQPLSHSLRTSNCKAIIFGSDFVDSVKNVKNTIDFNVELYQFNTKDNAEILNNSVDLVNELKGISCDYLGQDLVQTNMKDKMLYVFTSGTTGLPKAAVIIQQRFLLLVTAIKCVSIILPNDIIYTPLPMYHTSGTIIGIGSAIIFGNTVVIRRKFSASNYWKDCKKYKCTVAQYIGELCRYLLAVPPGDEAEKTHCVRLMYGNGLKAQIWNKFVQRFGIKQIFEFYGATEGNANLANYEGIPGAIGFKPRYIGNLFPVYLIRYNDQTGEPLRNEKGFCIPCKPNEPGILIGKVISQTAVNKFEGYTDKNETKKKLLENVFTKGDYFFNSGDVLVMDDLGYFYFKDRKGDTFRWKGENVATSEVEAIISDCVGLKDAVVYGVEIPNTDGCCGMASIVDTNNTLNLENLALTLRKNLPSYARPLFLRVMQSIPKTGTFKFQKYDLQTEGYDINKINDKLYFYDSKTGNFVPLTEEIYKDISSGKLRL